MGGMMQWLPRSPAAVLSVATQEWGHALDVNHAAVVGGVICRLEVVQHALRVREHEPERRSTAPSPPTCLQSDGELAFIGGGISRPARARLLWCRSSPGRTSGRAHHRFCHFQASSRFCRPLFSPMRLSKYLHHVHVKLAEEELGSAIRAHSDFRILTDCGGAAIAASIQRI